MTSATTAPDQGRSSHPAARDVLAELAERLGASVAAHTVYAPAVEREGVTVIPVASARFVFGGGSGADPQKGQEGEGGGGLGRITPVGYIELREGRTRFVPVVHPARIALLALGTVAAGAAAVALLAAGRPRARLLSRR